MSFKTLVLQCYSDYYTDDVQTGWLCHFKEKLQNEIEKLSYHSNEEIIYKFI